jgi:ribonucleoside-diphosphate reductase beta chain
MTRTIEHGNRNGYASLGAGGLSTESFPMRLFAKGNAKHWNPAEIDFAQDAEDLAAMTDDERRMTITLAASFMAGEESVTQDLQPFIAAMATENRLADEIYLTQFVYEEAKHTLAFRLWFDAVGLTQDLHEYIESNDAWMQIFTKELPASLYALEQDASPGNRFEHRSPTTTSSRGRSH